MFRTIEDVKRPWHAQSAGTLAVLGPLTDESLTEEIAPGHRTLGCQRADAARTPRPAKERRATFGTPAPEI